MFYLDDQISTIFLVLLFTIIEQIGEIEMRTNQKDTFKSLFYYILKEDKGFKYFYSFYLQIE